MTTVRFTRLRTRSSVVWIAVTLVLVLAASAYGAVTDPQARYWALFGPALVAVSLLSVQRTRHEVVRGTDGDTALVQRRLIRTHRASITHATALTLRSNGGGAVQLVVRDSAGSAFAPLLLLDQYAQVGQPVDVLHALVEAVRGSSARGAGDVATQLQAQLEHQRRGGSTATSPLAAVVRSVISAAGAAGAAGGVAGQL